MLICARGALRRNVIVLAVFSLLVSGAAARAADAEQKFAIHGAGAETCQQMIDSLRKDRSQGGIIASWVFGYLTALNRSTPDRFDVVYIDCTRNPTLALQSVVALLFDQLAIAGARTDSPVVSAKAHGKEVKIRTETLAAMQSALAAMGHYDGKPDGQFGPKVEEALRVYQRREKLPESGLPDPATIIRLLVEKSAGSPPAKSK